MEKSGKINPSISKYFIYLFLILTGVASFIYLDYRNISVPYDDAYSVFMVKLSYGEIIKVTAQDVHPPLYYLGLKAFSSVFGDSLFTLRLFSLSGVFATLLLGATSIRRMFGDGVAISFTLLMVLFPVTQYLVTDIRMYSWVMFFVLVTALYAYKVFMYGKLSNWLVFFVAGLVAGYTHNYGLLSILGIYIILFLFLYKDGKNWKGLFIVGGLFALAYLPWLFQLVDQIGMVSDDYWIKPLTLNDIFLHIYYFYSPKEVWLPFTYFSRAQMMVALIILMSVQLIITIVAWRIGGRIFRLAVLSFIAFLFPVVLGGIISVVWLPILVTRYMTCSFGLFVLSLSFVLAIVWENVKYRKLAYLFLLLLLIDAGVRYYSGLSYYKETEESYNKLRTFAKSDSFYANDFSYYMIPRLQLILPENKYSVLVSEKSKNNYLPFSIEEVRVNEKLGKEFILVHHMREAIEQDFHDYKMRIEDDYQVMDSLQVSDILLYKMEAKQDGTTNIKE
ncbi:MAG: glycosyltransferase family 39 protein [Dysgonomonas sp.]|nr:glycosyltransferase family 39 protein [Dysgonomonas sp.]